MQTIIVFINHAFYLLRMKLKDIMSKKVLALKPEQTIEDALHLFAKHNIHGAPVVDDSGYIVGIFTESDFLSALRKKTTNPQMVFPSIPLMGISFVDSPLQKEISDVVRETVKMPISKVMKKTVHTLPSSADVKDAIRMMITHRITRIPIMDDKKLVGIVTRTDIIKMGLGTED